MVGVILDNAVGHDLAVGQDEEDGHEGKFHGSVYELTDIIVNEQLVYHYYTLGK